MTPEAFDLLREALALARGSEFMHPYPEGAGPEHAAALLRLAGKMEEK